MQMLVEDSEKQAQAAATAQKERDAAMAKLSAMRSAGDYNAQAGSADAVAQLHGTVQGLETEVRVLSSRICSSR
jgi:hypothetical protein